MFLPLRKSFVGYEFSCRFEVRYVGRTMQRLADRIKQHVPTSIRAKNTIIREQPPRMCRNNNPKMACDSAMGQLPFANPECAKTYSDDNFRIIGQARSSFHLSVLESVYIKTENPVLCKQKEFIIHKIPSAKLQYKTRYSNIYILIEKLRMYTCINCGFCSSRESCSLKKK